MVYVLCVWGGVGVCVFGCAAETGEACVSHFAGIIVIVLAVVVVAK